MIKINSELPYCLFDKNNNLNEYDFVLFHLYQTNNEYKDYYLQQRKNHPGRLMILDNSAYEFFVKGEKLNYDDYRDAIIELQPDYYILPDFLMSYDKTTQETVWFLNNYSVFNSKPIGVLQGESEGELLECANLYKSLNIEAVAIPFHLSMFVNYDPYSYNDIIFDFYEQFGKLTKDTHYAIGRVKFLMKYGEFLKGKFKHIHILGSHNPYEKIYYKDFQTMDTGYPVKCAIKGYKLFKEPNKPEVIIDDFYGKDLDSKIKSLIVSNVKKFKKLQ